MDTIMNQIANFGFPIVLSIYLLVRVEGKLEKLTDSINELSRTIEGFKN
ncbi:YvrJ protein family protein [Caloramator mitchellensis]|uniref:YvrJ protein family protein n=1 Tax=Caloramator mitchellensis TaxID=908809 RepID=A0A0R3JVY9_CALMK|nr:YvrJ family protein [Caloramator mitchellensis]KRQ87721.1 YvrJ protein family protein [Caloramator mitchellensis]